MLETIREYARDKLEVAGEAAAITERHAKWCDELAERVESDSTAERAAEALARAGREIDNIRSAVSWGVENDKLLALRVLSNTRALWFETSRGPELQRLLEAAWTDDAPATLRKDALRARTAAALTQNDDATLAAVSHERLELARATGDREHEAAALGMLAAAAHNAGEADAARRYYEESIDVARASGQTSVLSTLIGNYGRFERHAGNYARSCDLLEEYLALTRASKNELDIAWAAKERAMTVIEEGDLSRGQELLREGFSISSQHGLSWTAGDLVFSVALLCSRTGRAREGAILFGAADAENEREGFKISASTSWWWELRKELAVSLGEAELDVLAEQGRSLELGAAVDLARKCLEEPHPPT
jgi:tetratricopeptide (TPR) repeat protein